MSDDGQGNNARDANGRVGKGNNLRKTGQRVRRRAIAKRLDREMIRRYSGEVIDETTGETMGKERATLKHYFVMMTIMADPNEASKDRLRAAEQLAVFKDGKPVDEVELSGFVESNNPLDKAMGGMTAEQLLELVRATRAK